MADLVEFFRLSGKLKRLPRTGWMEAGIEKPESVADHTLGTALIAMVLSDLRGLDTEKAIRMALLHDAAEAITGDLTPEQKNRMGPDYRLGEEAAMDTILSNLPKELSEAYRSIWQEYRDKASPEAKVVADADKADMFLQALEYEEEGVEPHQLERFRRVSVEDPLLSMLLKSITEKKGKG